MIPGGATTRRGFLKCSATLGLLRSLHAQHPALFAGNIVLGRPTDRSIAASVLAPEGMEAFIEYGVKPGSYAAQTGAAKLGADAPFEFTLSGLRPATRYSYRLRTRRGAADGWETSAEHSFHTQRRPGDEFAFTVQGDSHPERRNNMFHPDLYARTLANVARDQPDFHFTLGDDFSLDQLYNRGRMNEAEVGRLYADQRRFLATVGHSLPLFLVNGNHERGAKYLLDGTPVSAPVLAAQARNLHFPLPAPDAFYTGDSEPVEFVGLPRDYYAFTWGDALFVTLDPYWHSLGQVDDGLGGRQPEGAGGKKPRDWWDITIGDAQYQWFRKTLQESSARYKFVFTHHVLGTGRGGVELANLYEWGGYGRQGGWEFDRKRPDWELPIHQLMVKHGVTILFQGHDHLFACQKKDSIVYQETPNPADNTYTAFNAEAYRSGRVLPNSGHLRVTVSPAGVTVDYVRAYLPEDETADQKNGGVAFSYAA